MRRVLRKNEKKIVVIFWEIEKINIWRRMIVNKKSYTSNRNVRELSKSNLCSVNIMNRIQ